MKDHLRLEALAELLDQLQDINASPMMIACIKEEIHNLTNSNDTNKNQIDNG